MKKILFFLILIWIIGCQNKNELNKLSIVESNQIFSDSLNMMSFKAPKDSFRQDGFYSFSSKEANAKIFLEKIVSEDLGSIFSKEELIYKYKKNLSNVFIESKDDWFVIKGLDAKKKSVIIKGIYSYVDRLLSKDENPEADNKYILLASKAGVLKIEYSKNNAERIDQISKSILNSFVINYDNF